MTKASSASELRQIFERSITVRDVAEPLASFDASQYAGDVREYLEERNFDTAGVMRGGITAGYVLREDLADGSLGDHMHPFPDDSCISDTEPLLKLLGVLARSDRAFVVVKDTVWGIVTPADINKAPVRMWLFGLVSLIEVQMLRAIREEIEEADLESLLSQKRLDSTKRMHENRVKRNAEIDLLDCLQFGDKVMILKKLDGMATKVGFESKTKMNGVCSSLRKLRDELAHAQDIVASLWPKLSNISVEAERFLRQLEKL